MATNSHQVVVILIFMAVSCNGKNTYNMDDRADCNLAGFIDIEDDQTIYINAKDNLQSSLRLCRIDFQARDTQRLIKIEISSMYFYGNPPCPVDLQLFYGQTLGQPTKTLNCASPTPASEYTKARSISIRLNKIQLNNQQFNFQIILSTYLDTPDAGNTDYGKSTVNPGVIVGIVAGVVVFLVVIIVILCCCCRSRNQGKFRSDEEARARLAREHSNHSMGYINENGRAYSDYDSKPKITTFDGPGSPRTRNLSDYEANKKPPIDDYDASPTRNHHFKYGQNQSVNNYERDQNIRNNQINTRSPPTVNKFNSSPTRNQHFRYDREAIASQNSRTQNGPGNHGRSQNEDEGEPGGEEAPQSPLLAAIRSSARHKAHFQNTEEEAEERSKRFSSSAASSPEPPTPPPSLPVLPRENLLRGPQRPPGPKQASIRRAPRPTSSHEEIEQLGKAHDADVGDENIQIIPDSPLDKSQPEGVVPIQTADPHSPLPQRRGLFPSAEVEDDDEYYDDDEIVEYKNNTQHTLRPNRKRSPGAEKRKPPGLVAPKESQKPPNSLRMRPPTKDSRPQEVTDKKKKSQSSKSPRLGSNRRQRQQGASRGDEDEPPSRPDTPTSIVARGFRTDDLEGFSPLQRTGSRQSLYASRTSLYSRRGKRERSSFSSMASYAHDDIDVYRHRQGDDDDDRPMNKKDRYFKSLGDIHYGGPQREQSTQTLRETATQTGSGMVTHSKARKASSRKSPKSQRAMSSSGTQTKQNAKQFEPKVITPRYQKAGQNGKASKSVDTGVGPDESEKKTHGKPKSGRTEKPPKRAKTPDPIEDEEDQPRSRSPTPENNPPAHLTPGTAFVPPIPSHQMPPVSTFPQPPPSHVYQDRASPHVYTPPPIQNYSAPPYQPGPSPVPYGHPSPVPYGRPSPVPYGAPPPSSKPAKSNWDVLCDLTGGENQGRPQSRGPASHAGSSYSGHQPKQPFHPGFRQPERFDQSQHPDRTGPPSRSLTPGFPPAATQPSDRRPDSAQSDPQNTIAAGQEPTMYPKKSSWEQLKQLTDSQYKLTYGASNYAQSESNV